LREKIKLTRSLIPPRQRSRGIRSSKLGSRIMMEEVGSL
jgi:hypothetical protein